MNTLVVFVLAFILEALSTAITLNPKKQLPEFANWRLFSTDSLDPVERKLRRLDNFLSYFYFIYSSMALYQK